MNPKSPSEESKEQMRQKYKEQMREKYKEQMREEELLNKLDSEKRSNESIIKFGRELANRTRYPPNLTQKGGKRRKSKSKQRSTQTGGKRRKPRKTKKHRKKKSL